MTLHGSTIALAEGRQLEELAEMLEKEGATALRCPLVSIIDAPDPAPVVSWLRTLVGNRFAYVILFTGEGLRRLLAVAEREGMRESVIAALGETRLVTRGPKPVKALAEIGLRPALVAPMPTTDGVIASLRSEPLQGKTVGVQLYSADNPSLVHFLEEAGASVHTVLPYLYAPAADAERVGRLIERLAGGTVAAIIFTSSPQVDRLFEVAAERRIQAALQQGLERTRVAAVGPVVADDLRRHGVRVDICPQQGFVMKNLVQLLKRTLEHDRSDS
jgi:uroporphyrinogen-III synthase